MNCLSPISIARKGNNSDRVSVPCGKCVVCLSVKRTQWSYRLEQELKKSSSAYFVTLTYDNNFEKWGTRAGERLTIHEASREKDFPLMLPQLCKQDCQLFLKRLRKSLDDMRGRYVKSKKVSENALKVDKIKYYLVGEYGSVTNRPHYHAIIFNLPLIEKEKIDELILNSWRNGMIKIGNVTPASINYVTKYVITKNSENEYREPEFALISKGLGINYVNEKKNYHLKSKNFYITAQDGKKMNMPRYYKEKIFSKLDIMINSYICNKKYMEELKKSDDLIKSRGDEPIIQNARIREHLQETLKKRYTKNQKL